MTVTLPATAPTQFPDDRVLDFFFLFGGNVGGGSFVDVGVGMANGYMIAGAMPTNKVIVTNLMKLATATESIPQLLRISGKLGASTSGPGVAAFSNNAIKPVIPAATSSRVNCALPAT